MKRHSPHFWRSESAAVGAEFALIVPLLLVFIFAIIDVGRAMWTWNHAEKATHAGARYAAATNMLPAGLASYSFVIDGGMQQGLPISEADFGGATCTSTGCACMPGKTCPPLGAMDATEFANIVARMQAYFPTIEPENVEVDYQYSGIGYAGDPNGPDVAPLVTVRLVGMTFQPTLLLVFGQTLSLPQFPATLSLEDGSGGLSN